MTLSRQEQVFHGTGASPGVALGHALKLDSYHRVILKIHLDSTLVDEELTRLRRAIAASTEQLRLLRAELETKVGREHSSILDVHLLMLEDRGLLGEIEGLIRADKANAEWAVRQATDRIRDAYASLEDEYFRERGADIDNVVERILLNLAGSKPFTWEALPQDLILLSHDFNPSHFATVDLVRVRGLGLESGGRTSHTAILARSLRLPAVVGLREFLQAVNTGDTVVIDGDEGLLIVNPSHDRLDQIRDRLEEFRAAEEPPASGSDAAVRLEDGVLISLQANMELPHEVRSARTYGAEGIGLFRSEFLFFAHPNGFPGMSEQVEIYRMLADQMRPHPVAIRTLDTGADKITRDASGDMEPNPSMGLRGIRASFAARDLFATQIEAILRAGFTGNIEIVLPMISSVEEVREAREIIRSVQERIGVAGGSRSPDLAVGAMIEVPAAILSLEAIAHEVDFLSVGTNDLIQYLLAVDRGNPLVSHLYQPLHPSVLKCLARVSSVSRNTGKPVRVCGEISSNPFFAVLLVGMGFTRLSMNTRVIPTIRKVLQSVRLDAAQRIAEQAAQFATAREVGDYLVDAVSRIVQMNLTPYVKEIRTQEAYAQPMTAR